MPEHVVHARGTGAYGTFKVTGNISEYTQAGNLYRLMRAGEHSRLVAKFVGALKSVPVFIQERQIAQFYRADPEYGGRVAAGLKLDIDTVMAKSV